MKKGFEEFYQPTDNQFEELWQKADIVLDTNVLLNLYRYSAETRTELLGIIKGLRTQLWLPHRVAFEYQRRRIDVILEQARIYDAVSNALQHAGDLVAEELKEYVHRRHHPYLNIVDFINETKAMLAGLVTGIRKLESNHPEMVQNDPIRDELEALFDGRVGDPLPEAEQEALKKDAKVRYPEEIPPGYRDAKKSGGDALGDLILWYQVLRQATQEKRSVILVTDDQKDDWWLRVKGRTIGPRPELVREIMMKAGVKFYMYTVDRFMTYGTQHLKRDVQAQAIDEARELRREAEDYSARHTKALYEKLAAIRARQDQLTRPSDEDLEILRAKWGNTLMLSDLGLGSLQRELFNVYLKRLRDQQLLVDQGAGEAETRDLTVDRLLPEREDGGSASGS